MTVRVMMSDEIADTVYLFFREVTQPFHQPLRLIRSLSFLIFTVAGTVFLFANVDTDIMQDGSGLKNILRLGVKPFKNTDSSGIVMYFHEMLDTLRVPSVVFRHSDNELSMFNIQSCVCLCSVAKIVF